MRIKIPFELAIVIIVLVAIAAVVLGIGAVGRWIERTLGPAAQRAVAIVIALAASGAGLWYLSTFFLETRDRDPVHPGISLVASSDVLLAAVLLAVGSAAFVWGKLRPVGALAALGGGAALIAKPILYPLMSEGWGDKKGTFHPLGLTSETHLYFLLPGIALVVLGLVFLVLCLRKAAPQSPAGAGPPGMGGYAGGAWPPNGGGVGR
jgi:hypothetical protein